MPNREHHVARVRPSKERRLAALGLEPLAPNEVSARVRMRLDREVAALLEGLTPAQRGEVLVAGLKVLGFLREAGDGEAG
ncbi:MULTISPECIES: hypothetical protein [unclassified Meiothermus]|uniref:hypothetical protein n=1 Tax=unclassified Meiothermus TaxID=370471 RepID=UPI000D7D1817|nr:MULTISPECIES: hypothetical protein [unclassified Meiothermus]PZA06102.1 hypothetical protein DNA98_15125 [Meiothermus sp. Pnk-1]RYM35376.1 hypothetical protein EWH23_11335 [Meiothermus sp. PNK-Is4]